MRTLILPALLLASFAAAGATPQQIARLGTPALTCMGAEAAGSDAGVAAYSGRWLGAWPGFKADGFDPGPYAAEKPLFVITAANLAEHAAYLSEGQKALLQKYPSAFRMPVYPSHRDFRYADWMCDTVRRNAAEARLSADARGAVHRLGAIPFPFPETGVQAVLNINKNTGDFFSEEVLHSSAAVHPNGTITWGKVRLRVLLPWNRREPRGQTLTTASAVEALFWHEQLLPERDRGTLTVGSSPTDFSRNAHTISVYQPGTRRVRQLAELGPDYPAPPNGFHTVEDEALFNGSPERFSWKLVGKRELYVPYDNFGLDDPSLRYADLLQPHTLDPDRERYELHRVWVIEGTLKPGVRHVYGKRVLYVDEDTWQALWADSYDTRGALWRAAFGNYFYVPQAATFHRGVTLYHDLLADSYEAEYLVNESGRDGWRFNDPRLTSEMFSPSALARRGH